jgi:hypothetical protein
VLATLKELQLATLNVIPEGLAMGALTSTILAKVYIQFLEYNEIANILKKKIK